MSAVRQLLTSRRRWWKKLSDKLRSELEKKNDTRGSPVVTAPASYWPRRSGNLTTWRQRRLQVAYISLLLPFIAFPFHRTIYISVQHCCEAQCIQQQFYLSASVCPKVSVCRTLQNDNDRMLFRKAYSVCVWLLSWLYFIHFTPVFVLFCTSCYCIYFIVFIFFLHNLFTSAFCHLYFYMNTI